jgi:transaldolase
MRFFVDSANIDEIKAAFDLGIVSGVTTNPVLIRRENTFEIRKRVEEIRAVCDGEIFTQVLGRSCDEMVAQGKRIWAWDKNITVKIPLNAAGIKAVSILTREGVRTCATIVYTPAQALAAAVAGASYVALFVNRSHEMGYDGFALVRQVVALCRAGNFKTQVLAASVGSPMDVVRVAAEGADVATAPGGTWLGMTKSGAADATLESFLKDWDGRDIG